MEQNKAYVEQIKTLLEEIKFLREQIEVMNRRLFGKSKDANKKLYSVGITTFKCYVQ